VDGVPAIEIGRRSQDEALASCDAASGQRRVHHLSHPESHVDALLDKVDLAVVQNDFQIHVWILRQEFRQHRNEMDPGKCDGSADPQSPLESGPGSPRGEFGLGSLLEGALGTFEIAEPGFRRGEPVCRTRQQLDPRYSSSWATDFETAG
jgi:hypothetical protein